MPPPKKPKNGPTSVEQFLSQEELKFFGRDSRRPGQRTRDAVSGAQGEAGDPIPASSSSSHGKEPDPASAGPAASTSSPCSSRDTSPNSVVGQTSPVQRKLSVSALLLAQNPSSLLADERGPDPSTNSTSTTPSSTKYLRTPPELLSTTSFLVSSSGNSSLLPASPASPLAANSSSSSSSTPTVAGGGSGGGDGTTHAEVDVKSAAAASGGGDSGGVSGGSGGSFNNNNNNNNNNNSGNKPSGSILHKLFASRTTENILTDESSAFREQLQQHHQQQQQHLHPSPQQPLWHTGMVSATIGQPQVYASESRLANLGYRFPTSSNLASLINRPAWLNFEHSRHLGAVGQAGPLGILRPVSGLDLPVFHSAATGMQHHHQQQQQQQQHQQQQQQQLDGRSLVASMITSQLSSESPDPTLSSPSSSDDVFMVKSTPSPRGSNAPSYLSSLIIRQPLPQHAKSVRSGASGAAYPSGSRSESAQVYLQTFQLPPSTTSGIRKNKSTSSLPFLHAAPAGNACLSGLPPLDNAKMFPVRTSPVNQAQPHARPVISGNKHVSSNINTTTTSDKNNSLSSIISSGSSLSFSTTSVKKDASMKYEPAGIGEPFDLSLKTSRLFEELKNSSSSSSSSKDNANSNNTGGAAGLTATNSPSRKSSPSYAPTGSAENSPSSSGCIVQRSPSTSETATVAMESDDDSNSDINVTSPVPPCTLLRALSQPTDSSSISTSVLEGVSSPDPPLPAPSSLITLLSSNNNNNNNNTNNNNNNNSNNNNSASSKLPSPDPGPAATTVKEEVGVGIGAPTVPYDHKLPCKQEAFSQPYPSSGANLGRSGEPSDCKSPKEEVRMVSPSSGMQVVPLGGAGEGQAGSAHQQAATSTTPEAGPAPLPHNFLMDMQGHNMGAGPSQSPHMKQEMGGTVPGSSMQTKLCQVCNDNASGFHYGVWSCEGCKAFFKRSIQGPVDYICPATNTCTIDKHRRKSCQACRLRRCYEVGMNKGSQRKERKSSSNSLSKGKRCRADSSDSTVNSTNGASSSKAAKRCRSASILEALQKADLPVLESHHNHSHPPTRVHLLNTLIKLADRELVYLINWAKHVPGYTHLTLGDQVHLIECCWMELLLLNCAFRSMEHEGRTLVFAPDFHLERQQWAITGMGDVLEQVSAVSEQMVLCGLNKEELLLLQATVLVNAEVRRLESFLKIQEMRQVILDVFMEVAGRHQGYGNWRHAPSILLLLTHIRQASERGITYFQRLKMEGCVTFCDLLTEMLDAHNSGDRRRLQQQQQQQQQQQHHQVQQQQQQQQQLSHQHLQHQAPPPHQPPHQQPPHHSQQHPAHHPHPHSQPPSHSMPPE